MKYYYFSHDSNAYYDRKIVAMRTKYGVSGYGFYWYLVEQMRNEPDYRLPVNDEFFVNSLVKEFSEIPVMEYITDCVKIGLFILEDGKLFSESFIDRMNLMEKKLQIKRENGRLGGRPKTESKPKPNLKKPKPNLTETKSQFAENLTEPNIKENININNGINTIIISDDDDDLTPPDFKQHKKLLSTWISAKKTHPTDIEFNALIDLAKQYGEMETRQAIAEAGKCKGDDFSVKYVTAILKNQKNGTIKGEKNNGTYTGFNQEEYERSAKEYQELINAKRAAQRN